MSLKALMPIVAVVILAASCIPLAAPDADGDGTDFPSSYDQRDLGIVTPVKDQSPWGTCWAFSGVSAAETSILTYLGMTYEETGLDLSERHTAFFSKNHITSEISEDQAGEGLYPPTDDPNLVFLNGGYHTFFTKLFANGVGPLPEYYYPYQGNEGFTTLETLLDPETSEEVAIKLMFDRTPEEEREKIESYTPEKLDDFYKSLVDLGLVFPEGVDGTNLTYEDVLDATLDFLIDYYTEHDRYSTLDDWSLDLRDYNYSMGFSLLEGNYLPSPAVLDEDNNLKEIDWDAVGCIKTELLLGRGVVCAYYVLETTNKTWCFYQDKEAKQNHMVQIIGWDDDVPKENFTTQPPGDGAWLCKNSWGSETNPITIGDHESRSAWGIVDEEGKHTGYFWLSYYDKSIGFAESLVFTDVLYTDEGFYCFAYDFLPDFGNMPMESDSVVKCANIFTADEACLMNALSVKTCDQNSHITVSVYKNVKDDPESGRLVARIETTFRYAGYHVLMLDDHIRLHTGDRFSVVMEEVSPSGQHRLAVQSVVPEDDWTSVTVVNEGESALYQDGVWYDWKEMQESNPGMFGEQMCDNFGLKVFALPYEESETDYLYDSILVLIVAGLLSCFVIRRLRRATVRKDGFRRPRHVPTADMQKYISPVKSGFGHCVRRSYGGRKAQDGTGMLRGIAGRLPGGVRLRDARQLAVDIGHVLHSRHRIGAVHLRIAETEEGRQDRHPHRDSDIPGRLRPVLGAVRLRVLLRIPDRGAGDPDAQLRHHLHAHRILQPQDLQGAHRHLPDIRVLRHGQRCGGFHIRPLRGRPGCGGDQPGGHTGPGVRPGPGAHQRPGLPAVLQVRRRRALLHGAVRPGGVRMTLTREQERKIDLACIILLPLGQLIFGIASRMGLAIGQYGDTYIFSTFIVMAIIVVILPIIRYKRWLVFPYWFVAMVSLCIYIYSVPLFLGFFDNLWWWDEFSHWYSSVIVSMIVFLALCLMQYSAKRMYMSIPVLAFLTFFMGFGFGCVWEVYEGTVDWVFNGSYMSYSVFDSLCDIHMDFLGSLTMAVIGAIVVYRKPIDEMIDGIDEKRLIHNFVHKDRTKMGAKK